MTFVLVLYNVFFLCSCSAENAEQTQTDITPEQNDITQMQLPDAQTAANEPDDDTPVFSQQELLQQRYDEIGDKDGLSRACVEFLMKHNVPFDELAEQYAPKVKGSADEILGSYEVYQYDESLKLLVNEAQAYDFTDEQIEKYIIGFISEPSIIIQSSLQDDTAVSLAAANRPSDTGIGYEVKTVEGYFQTTAFVTLPEVYRTTSSQYMFFTVSGVGTSWCIDVGVWYANGNRGEGWRACYTADKTLGSSKIIPELSAGKEVYFSARVQADGFLRFRILDAEDFSVVYYDMLYDVQSRGIYQDNACINRQISLCNNSSDFTDGSYCLSAKFSDVYVYNIDGGVQPNDDIVEPDRCGAFGTNDENRSQVAVNSYTPWCDEDISIYFNNVDTQT